MRNVGILECSIFQNIQCRAIEPKLDGGLERGPAIRQDAQLLRSRSDNVIFLSAREPHTIALTMGSKTVFISYRRDAAGKGFAQAINLALTARGYDVFLDVITVAAGRWEKQILAQVPEQAHFLLLLTPGALDGCDDEKDWVRREFELAVRNNRNIVPVKEESVDLEQVRDSCPDSMKGVFEFQNFTVRHDAFIRDIEMLVSDYIAPHFAPQPRLDLSISRMLTEIFDGSTKRVVNSFGQSLKDRPLIIPVFGASGVGRTQILNGLLGNPIVKIDRYERTEFQVGHKPFRNPKIAESLSIVTGRSQISRMSPY